MAGPTPHGETLVRPEGGPPGGRLPRGGRAAGGRGTRRGTRRAGRGRLPRPTALSAPTSWWASSGCRRTGPRARAAAGRPRPELTHRTLAGGAGSRRRGRTAAGPRPGSQTPGPAAETPERGPPAGEGTPAPMPPV